MKYYKTKLKKILSISSSPFELKEGEKQFSFNNEIISYHFDVNNDLIDDTTQADRDAQTALREEQDLEDLIREELQDGIKASEKLVLYIRQLGLTPTQLLTAKKTLLPVYKALKDGNWDIAQEEMDLINRPSGAFGTVYDNIKAKIDAYVGN